MKQLLEKLLVAITALMDMVQNMINDVEANEVNEADAAIGKAVRRACEGSRILRDLYSVDGMIDTPPGQYADLILALIQWEDRFEGKDSDTVLSVYEVCDDHNMTDTDELGDYFERTSYAMEVIDRIDRETDVDSTDDNEIIEKLQAQTISDDDVSNVKDAVDTLREIVRNW